MTGAHVALAGELSFGVSRRASAQIGARALLPSRASTRLGLRSVGESGAGGQSAPRVPSADERGRGWGHMRRASSFISSLSKSDASVATPSDPGGVLPTHHHRRMSASLGRPGRLRDPKVTKRRRALFRRLRACVSVVAVLVALRLVVLLATWYPGDETIRASSEGPLRLMFSRSGLSFGTLREVHFRSEVQIDAGDAAIRKTTQGYTVQGKISKRPRWTEDMNVTREAELGLAPPPSAGGDGRSCFFRVHRDALALTLLDDGVAIELALGESAANDVTIDQLRCVYFRAMSEESHRALRAASDFSAARVEAPVVVPDGASGRVLMMNSATTLDMLSEYHRTLLNHQAYAEDHHYGYVLALVKTSSLGGRSGKFAKHLATGAQLAQRFIPSRVDAGADWDAVCHMDLDAWYASWAPFSAYGDAWSRDKDLLFGDAGQIWLNTGLMCARPTRWAVAFFEGVVNAVFSGVAPEDAEGIAAERAAGRALVGDEERVGSDPGSNADFARGGIAAAAGTRYGFKRDQPAVWHALATAWARERGVPYRAQACDAWHRACNPDENPIECWHWCHWDALQRVPGWEGLSDVDRLLTRVQLAPRAGYGTAGAPPQMHRMCLRSCRSVLARGFMGACGMLTGGAQFCYPNDVDKMSLCDGVGCLGQMRDRGGAWIKHTGHQHWRDALPSCVPTTEEEAMREQRDHTALCRQERG